MRTTITIADRTHEQLTNYAAAFERLYRRRPTASEILEECAAIGLPLLFERLPKAAETPKAAIKRRASTIEGRIRRDQLTEEEVITLMKEALRLQDDARAIYLQHAAESNDIDTYRECIDAALTAYNVGAMRLNMGNVPPGS